MRVASTPLGYGRTMRLCGCSMTKRRKARPTRVGVYVDKKAEALAARIHVVMRKHADELKAIVRRRLKKADDLSPEDQIVRDQILNEFDATAFSGDLLDEITPDMIEAYRAGGIRSVIDLIVGQPTEDITSQIDQAALAYIQAHAAELITDISDTTIEDLRDFFGESLAAGLSDEEIAIAIDDYYAFGESRAMTIARTELAAAHVAGNVEGWKQADVNVTGKRWILGDTHPQEDECDDAADAGVVGVDEDFVPGIDLPPAHPNAVLEGSAFASYGELQQMVRAWYVGPAITIFCESKHVTIGPNHPMLTARGFVRAEEIQEGDELLYDLACDGLRSSAVKPDLQQVMRVEDAFRALASICGYANIAGPRDYFHGDEKFVYGEVDVVRPKRGLLPVLDAGIIEKPCKDLLMRADTETEPFARSSTFLSDVDGIGPTTPGLESVRGDCLAFLGGHSGVSRFHRCRVVATHAHHFEGYAFDASTATSIYSSGGFVVKNCICDVVPVISEGEES